MLPDVEEGSSAIWFMVAACTALVKGHQPRSQAVGCSPSSFAEWKREAQAGDWWQLKSSTVIPMAVLGMFKASSDSITTT